MAKGFLIQKVTVVALVVVMAVCASVTASATAEKVQELAGLGETVAVMQTLDVMDTKIERIMEDMVLFTEDVGANRINSITNFERKKVYLSGTFSDITESMWSYDYVRQAYELGIMEGTEGKFNPRGSLTGAEAITIGARIHCIYTYGDDRRINDLKRDGDQWFSKYVLYSKAEGLIGNELDSLLTTPITRAQMVHAWSKLLLGSDMKKQNVVDRIPDVDSTTQYSQDIVSFYEAGVISGVDDIGSFSPSSSITREQCSTIFMRLVKPELRSSGKVYSSQTQMIGDVLFNPKTDITYDSGGNAVISRSSQNKFIESMIAKSQGVIISNEKKSIEIDFNLVPLPEGFSWSISVDWGIPNERLSGSNTGQSGVIRNGHYVDSITSSYEPEYFEVIICIVSEDGRHAGTICTSYDFDNPSNNYSSYGGGNNGEDLPANVDSWIDQIYTIK